MRAIPLILLSLSMYFLEVSGHAQTGKIRGTVIDIDSRPVANATVYATPEEKMLNEPAEATTNEKGQFFFTESAIGGIYLNASKPEDGYPYSIFSFYVLPGEHLPKIEVKQGALTDGVLIQLGKRVAYLSIKILDGDEKVVPGTLLFTRPDLPGVYQRGFSGNGSIAVPPVAFRLSVEVEGYAKWNFQGAGGSELITLSSGEHFAVNAHLRALK